MEPHNTKEGIRSIWKVIFGTMIFVSLTGASWHLGEMRDVHSAEREAAKVVQAEVTQLQSYRDIVAKDGTTTGKVFLESRTKNTYGF